MKNEYRLLSNESSWLAIMSIVSRIVSEKSMVEHFIGTDKLSKTFVIENLEKFLICDSNKVLFESYWLSE